MAKKTTKKKPVAAKAKKKAPAKTSAKKQVEHVEIELDSVEAKAYELAHSSSEMCEELEVAVSLAISEAVRKIFKKHRISLTMPQAQKVALFLFGD
jgi:hypothetical protein